MGMFMAQAPRVCVQNTEERNDLFILILILVYLGVCPHFGTYITP